MMRQFTFTRYAVLVLAMLTQSAAAYEAPSRKIQIMPYLNILMTDNFWGDPEARNLVANNAGLGFGLQIRNQITGPVGAVVYGSLTSIDVADSLFGMSVMFGFGGYIEKVTRVGTFVFDCSYGIVTAGNGTMGLFQPGLEYSRPLSDRVSLALGMRWPIPNDWFYDYEFEEHYRSWAVSVGSIFVF